MGDSVSADTSMLIRLSGLPYYRAMYAYFMETHLSGHQYRTGIASNDACHQPALTKHSDTTRKSLHVASLAAAAMEPLSTADIIMNVFDRITDITADKPVTFRLEDLHPEPTYESFYDAREELSYTVQQTQGTHETKPLSCSSSLQKLAWVLEYDTVEP